MGLFFLALDPEIAEEARGLWGGKIGPACGPNSEPIHKYMTAGFSALTAIRALCPYLVGCKREKAEIIIEKWKTPDDHELERSA